MGEQASRPTRLPRRTPHGSTAVLLALLTVAMSACTSARAPEAARGSDPPARTVATRTLGPRMRDLTIDSPALGRTAEVRLLLPRRFRAQPTRRWPVLWLLHGCCDTYRSWTRSTDVEELAELADVLVVMPEAGEVGFYSDWYNGGREGPPRWETFHLTELQQLLERDWRAGDRRVIAGLSMGGLGAMAYAARHPGMFAAAASYSGLLHTRYQGGPVPGPQAVQDLLRAFGEDPHALWGDPTRQSDGWAGHNPYDLAPRLRDIRLFVSVGNGEPGPLDGSHRNAKPRLPRNATWLLEVRTSTVPSPSRTEHTVSNTASASGWPAKKSSISIRAPLLSLAWSYRGPLTVGGHVASNGCRYVSSATMKVTGCCASCAVGPVSGHLATCQMMLASAQGMPAPRVAEVTFTNPDRVRDVIHTFNTPTRGA